MRRKDGSEYKRDKNAYQNPEWMQGSVDAAREDKWKKELRQKVADARVQNTNRQRIEWLKDAAFRDKQMGIFPRNPKEAWGQVVNQKYVPSPAEIKARDKAIEAIQSRAQGMADKIKPNDKWKKR